MHSPDALGRGVVCAGDAAGCAAANEAREALEAEKRNLTALLHETTEKLRKEEAEALQLRRDVEGLEQRLQETVDAARRKEEALTIQLETEANKHQKEMDIARKQMYGGRFPTRYRQSAESRNLNQGRR